MTNNQGVLFVVATPIGNLRDLSARAVDTLQEVKRIAAEDTRHSKKLLAHFGIATPLVALHEHNEREVTGTLLRALASGEDLALISDAGTPLVSDPGFFLVRSAREAGITVVPVPGPSACIAALSVSALPTDRFVFEGFLPARQVARRQRLADLQDESRTLIFYESSHRIVDSLADMADMLGGERQAVLARELTKTYETVKGGTLAELLEWLQRDPNQQRGEIVILVHGKPAGRDTGLDRTTEHVLEVLMQELPLKRAAVVAAEITGFAKNRLYQRGLEMKRERDE